MESMTGFGQKDNAMSDSTPHVQRGQATPSNDGGTLVGGSSVRAASRSGIDEPTIITGRPPITPPMAGESVYRILEGRIMPGDRLGHFELVEFVGGGGMGRVFRAIDTQLGRTVAVKVLSPEQAADPDALQRFQNEAQSSARLDHDNIARAYYLGEDRGLHFIVFEFIEGVNIRALVEQKGPLPMAEAVSYTLQVAEALTHADSRAVVHRDIKPSNVLITPEGRVKLIDLGLARLRHADPAVADLTASGVTLGTFDYISPEQARDPRNADIRSDIYSLGCTFFFMLASQPPFPDGTVLQKLLQHQGDEPPDIQHLRPELPDELNRVLRKMMAKDPKQRYATPQDLVSDLLQLAAQIGLQPMSPISRIWLVPQEPTVSLFQQHLPWLMPVAALIFIVLMLDRYWSMSARRDEHLPPSVEMADRLPNQADVAIRPEGDGKSVAIPKTPAKSSPQSVGSTPKMADLEKPLATNTEASLPRNLEKSAVSETPKVGVSSGTGSSASRSESLPPGDSRRLASVDHPAAAKNVPKESVSPTTPSKRPNVWSVCETPRGNAQFSTLTAACAAARDGDVVELRYNGLREERPLKISNLRIAIRAGDGFRPTIAFRPNEADPVKYPRSMISLAGGELTFSDVTMELQVPRGVPAEDWSLFETCGSQTVRLNRCLLTVSNASNQGLVYHQDVAFFRVRTSRDTAISVAAMPLAVLELTDSVARGEADFLRVEEMQPVHLTWDNGLLLTSERLLAADGVQTSPKSDETLQVELRHVTVEARGGLCQLVNTSLAPYQLPVQFISSNSIFRTAPGISLIAQEGAADANNLRQRFLWSGDRNFYENITVFWTVRNNLDLEMPSDSMNFDAWKAYWGPSREDQPSTEKLFWKHAANADQPLHARGPGDYTLEDPTGGDAAAGAPGCRGDRLPEVPPGSASRAFRDTMFPRRDRES